MNNSVSKHLKKLAQGYARERGLGNWKFAYKELKKLWKSTLRNKKHTIGV